MISLPSRLPQNVNTCLFHKEEVITGTFSANAKSFRELTEDHKIQKEKILTAMSQQILDTELSFQSEDKTISRGLCRESSFRSQNSRANNANGPIRRARKASTSMISKIKQNLSRDSSCRSLNTSCDDLSRQSSFRSLDTSATSASSGGGILMLELIELKEELAQEKEELDYLRQQVVEEERKRDELKHQADEEAKIKSLCSELVELSHVYEDLEDSIGILDLEMQMLDDESWTLQQHINVENNKERGGRPTMIKQRSSRSLRHQKRRSTAPLSSINRLDSLQQNPMISRTA